MTEPSAKIVADSISPAGHRLTTMEIVMHRFVLAEFNTHRAFCLAGDSKLEFEAPGGNSKNPNWRRGHVMTIADFVERWQNGGASRRNGGRYRLGNGTNRQPMKNRLAQMNIRQLNEKTGLIQTSHVVDAIFSGEKPVYQITAGDFTVAGSADHQIWTPDGYRTIGELRHGDEIVVQRKGKLPDEIADEKRLKYLQGQWRSVWQRKQRERLIEEFGGCQKCDSTVGLQVHHIIPVIENPDLAFDEDNILLLCEECHRGQHHTQGWQAGQHLIGVPITVQRIGKCGVEPTFDLEIAGEFPNFIANGVVVHNSRNSASSRAIPLSVTLQQYDSDPAWPISYPAEKAGMSGGAELQSDNLEDARALLHAIKFETYELVQLYLDDHPDPATRLHKSVLNRYLEPFRWHTVVCTSTEWSNYFRQRVSPLAQPEMRVVAEAMQACYEENEPLVISNGGWHRPYVDAKEALDVSNYAFEQIFNEEDALNGVSAARCARVSRERQGGNDIEADVKMYNLLCDPGDGPPHASPLEHVATPCPEGFIEGDAHQVLDHRGNFTGWDQLRHKVLGF